MLNCSTSDRSILCLIPYLVSSIINGSPHLHINSTPVEKTSTFFFQPCLILRTGLPPSFLLLPSFPRGQSAITPFMDLLFTAQSTATGDPASASPSSAQGAVQPNRLTNIHGLNPSEPIFPLEALSLSGLVTLLLANSKAYPLQLPSSLTVMLLLGVPPLAPVLHNGT